MTLRELLDAWAFDLVVNGMIMSRVIPRPMRWRLLRFMMVPVEHSAIESRVVIGSRRVAIEQGAFLNVGCYLDGSAEVKVGARTQLGPEYASSPGPMKSALPKRVLLPPERRPLLLVLAVGSAPESLFSRASVSGQASWSRRELS